MPVHPASPIWGYLLFCQNRRDMITSLAHEIKYDIWHIQIAVCKINASEIDMEAQNNCKSSIRHGRGICVDFTQIEDWYFSSVQLRIVISNVIYCAFKCLFVEDDYWNCESFYFFNWLMINKVSTILFELILKLPFFINMQINPDD